MARFWRGPRATASGRTTSGSDRPPGSATRAPRRSFRRAARRRLGLGEERARVGDLPARPPQASEVARGAELEALCALATRDVDRFPEARLRVRLRRLRRGTARPPR